MNIKNIPLIFFISFIIFSCNETQEKDLNNNNNNSTPPVTRKEEEEKKTKAPKIDEYTEEKVDLGLSKEDEHLLLFKEKYPLGTNFKKIHDELGIKGIRPEGGSDELAAQGLTESKTKVKFLNSTVDLEFNFKNDSLYSYYYFLTESDFDKAERIYKGIQQFYNKKIGQCIVPPAEEENKHIRTSLWINKAPYGVLTYNVNTGVISWGFQNTKP